MPFVSRKKYEALLQAKSEALAGIEDLEIVKRVIRECEKELDSVVNFLKFLAARVPDYEGYILEYMEFEESENAGD